MYSEINSKLRGIESLLDRIRDATCHEQQKERLAVLEQQMSVTDFWEDRDQAEKTISELKRVKESVQSIDDLAQKVEDALEMLELAQADKDSETLQEIENESVLLLERSERLELKTLLRGKYDAANAYLEIQAGAGGTDACDWTLMVQRMFLRWAEQQGYRTTIIDEQPAEEAGLKSSTIYLRGDYAYGYLRAESGVHRIVRISPFDAQARRQTAFASVRVVPETDVVDDVEVAEVDLRVDTYRASGAGGQHVNTTDSAVRITHLPSGIVVQCQNERSQHANRAQAMRVLKARILEAEERKRREEMNRIQGIKSDIAFGSQIRSYVLHPYKMVKDHRTDHETSNTDAVLDGDLQPFIESWLRQQSRTDQAAR
ncbi:MAG: peptide chain release factor 2 [Planctomycetota bacterium]|nr:peptide chain release factor 2 [Planctomycetota bacterium]